MLQLTVDCQKRLQELFGNKRLRQIPEELLEQRGHVVHGDFLVEGDLPAAVEILPQLPHPLPGRGHPENAHGSEPVLLQMANALNHDLGHVGRVSGAGATTQGRGRRGTPGEVR